MSTNLWSINRNPSVDQCYGQLRRAGYSASESLRTAKIVAQFKEHEDALVRLRAEHEQESYFDVYGAPEGYVDEQGKRISAKQERKELEGQIERLGCWIVISEWRASEDDDWQIADTVGMCTGYRNPLSPVENSYVPDLMQAALCALENAAIARHGMRRMEALTSRLVECLSYANTYEQRKAYERQKRYLDTAPAN